MLSRLLQWNRERVRWRQEHEHAWTGYANLTDTGLSRFQIECEAALTSALQGIGVALEHRSIEGGREPYVMARLGGTDWTVWIYVVGAEVSSPTATLVRMEEWDARTPAEFIEEFVARTISEGSRVSAHA